MTPCLPWIRVASNAMHVGLSFREIRYQQIESGPGHNLVRTFSHLREPCVMIMSPTKNQREFVQDIESGIAALKQQDIKVTTLRQIMEAAGYELADFSGYVKRLQSQHCWDMILKVKDMIESVGMKVPTSIAQALNYLPADFDSFQGPQSGSIALKLQPETFAQPIAPSAGRALVEADLLPMSQSTQSTVSPDRAREVIIDLLNPMHKHEQVRIIDTVARWFGVGT